MTRTLLRALNTPLLILFVIIGLAIQSSLFAPWPLNYFQPDFVLLTVVWCALRRNFGEGGVITLFIANASEIHSSAPQGTHLVSYMAVYFFMRSASQFFVIPNLFSYAMFTLISSIIWKLVGLLILHLLGASGNQWRHTLTYLFLDASVGAAYSLWVFRWLEKFDWITFKNARAEHVVDEELQLENEGF